MWAGNCVSRIEMTAPLEDEKLQQYFDAELAEEEMSEIRAILAESEGDQRRLDALARLRELVNLAADADAEGLDSEEMFDNVRLGMRTGQSMRVIHGGAEPTREPPKSLEPWKLAAPAVMLAIAAGVALALFGPGQTPDDSVADDDPVVEESPEIVIDDDHSEAIVHVEPPHGSEVIEVDFGENTGTVFAVEGEAGEPIAVVWITDEEVTQ
jgi:hypothetical protein